MKTITNYSLLLFHFFFLCISTNTSIAQNCNAASLNDFFDCYGGSSAFSNHSVEAITTFMEAEDAINAGNYSQAKTLIDILFTSYPKGNTVWWNIYNNINGANIGSPNGYYGLRMMEDIANYHLNKDQNTQAKKVYMNIVLVGCSEGIQPTTATELQNGTGPFITNTIDPSLQQDDYRIVRQSLDLFSKYVTAITKGKIELELDFIELPNLCMPVNVSTTQPYVASGSISPVWQTISNQIKESTDWWWVIYPSHVPEYATFDDKSFITGGMGLDEKGGPAFIIDDKWIVRKPAHLGNGNYSDIERRAYLPQWFQHEFFHHLYRAYPELELEVNGHDWFDANFWPSDFEVRDAVLEPDFYAESLYKRLQVDCTPMTKKLITRIDNEFLQQFDMISEDELIGTYSLDNIENDWHIGEILKQGNKYFWRNNANQQWEATPNLANGKLETGNDSPYPGQDFFIDLYQNQDANYIPGITGLKYNGGFYKKRFNLFRESIPSEIVLGNYQRIPTQSNTHTGSILKDAGKFYWKNNAGNRWLLTIDTANEYINLHTDSPTPEEKFHVVITEDECSIDILGFKYLEDYYWKPKKDPLNESPGLINAIADLELEENFGNYSIDLSSVFSDPENDPLLLVATSSNPSHINVTINNEQLSISGQNIGISTIIITAIDSNGGLVIDEFNIEVVASLSNNNPELINDLISLFPNPTKNHITIFGKLSNYDISISNINYSFKPEISSSDNKIKIDLSKLSSGIYFITVSDKVTGEKEIKKVIKY